MTRKTTTCLCISEENMEWLRSQETGISGTIGEMIDMIRTDPQFATAAGVAFSKRSGVSLEAYEATKKTLIEGKVDRTVKIKAYFLDCPWIVYNAKTQRKFTKKDLCKIKDDLFWSKYNIDVTTIEIRTILKESIDAFDVESYLKRCKEAVPTVM